MSNDRETNTVSTLEGKYANYFRIGFNAQEFLFDFGQLEQGYEDDEGRCHTRIVVVPANAKRLLALLEKSINGYEYAFGAITEFGE